MPVRKSRRDKRRRAKVRSRSAVRDSFICGQVAARDGRLRREYMLRDHGCNVTRVGSSTFICREREDVVAPLATQRRISVADPIVAALAGYTNRVAKFVQWQSSAAKIPAIHAGNIDLEEFERCDGAEGLYVLHRDSGEWYFSFQEPATVVSREVRPGGL
ncbi:hypothetical protein DBV15_04214 [Temnothorax longispinosus]|uniref:Uncharacterized protein n=1 Tax=Temnothorax longispinosus TaxID=300112 RepID=A0A4S2KD85_9HYME|nr:hypothetical protein DBV15_04214 [Temnothorax longispinosus]